MYTSTRYLCTCTAFSNRKSEEKKKHACIYGFCQIQKVKSGKTQIGILVGRQSTSPPGTSPFGFWYPEDWRNSVLSAPRYPVDWRDSVLSASRYPEDWRDSVLSAFMHPVDWRDSVLSATRYPGNRRESDLSAPQVSCGLAELSHFSPQVP